MSGSEIKAQRERARAIAAAWRDLPTTPVPISELRTGNRRGFFARRPGERAAAYKRRLLDDIDRFSDGFEDDKAKVLRYAKAMASGAEFPPIFVLRRPGDHFIGDGHHRAGSAAVLGRTMIPAVVIDAASDDDASRALDLFHYLELDRDIATRTALYAVVARFGRKRPLMENSRDAPA